MTATTFNPTANLIIVNALLTTERGVSTDLLVALDTGSSETLVRPEVTDRLGYNARHGDAITVIHSDIGEERGYTMRVERFSALGFSVPDFRIHVHDLPSGHGVHGLLGLSFLKRLNYEVRSREGRILAEWIASLP